MGVAGPANSKVDLAPLARQRTVPGCEWVLNSLNV